MARELPHDLLAERSLIACLIIDGAAFDIISDLNISVEDFYSKKHAIIYESLKDLFLANEPIDFVTLCVRLNNARKLENLGGKEFILTIVEEQASAVNVAHYAKIVKDKSNLRKIVILTAEISELGMSYTGNTDEFLNDVEGKLFKLTNQSKTGAMKKINYFLKENLRDLENNDRDAGEISGLSTGYGRLDEFLLGLRPGQLIILAARPSMGKTALALNIATKVAIATGFPVAIFSLEMMSVDLSMRMLSAKAKVNSKKLKTKSFNDVDLKSIGYAVHELSKLPIFINDSGSVSLFEIQGQCRKLKAEQGLGMIVIDYLQLMGPTSGGSNTPREQQISEISRGLKNMAKELECPILALSQLNRAVETRPNKRPNTSDLRESGAIEQDADVVMFIYRDEYYNPNSVEKNIAEIIVAKNRSGETGTAKLTWIGSYTSFETLKTVTADNAEL